MTSTTCASPRDDAGCQDSVAAARPIASVVQVALARSFVAVSLEFDVAINRRGGAVGVVMVAAEVPVRGGLVLE